MIYYMIYTENDQSQAIADGYDKHTVIEEAEAYLTSQSNDNSEYGSFINDCIIYSYDDEKDIELETPITICSGNVNDFYDGGQSFYNSSRV